MEKYAFVFSLLLIAVSSHGQTRYEVSSRSEFSAAQAEATAGDSIVWLSGTYSDTRMEITKDGLIVTAEGNGTVLFTGASRAVIEANDVTFSGFQYVGGAIGSLHVVEVSGSDILITQVNIQNYTSHKYLIVYAQSRRVTISYCNFENRLNLADQNILSLLVDSEPGYHKVQYCSFKNFAGIGNDQGVEPIRIGVSSQGDLDSRSLVEYCYFTRCNGDGEIISHKSRQNVYRYNTFENNPVAELVLRHGDEGIVYGNFFLNNMGGIRIREGSEHFVYNNYFQDLDRRAIFLQNDPSDPLSDIHIYHNTMVNSAEVILGSSGSNPPTNVTIANNIFANPTDELFTQDTETETWLSNLSLGDLGIDRPAVGLLEQDPLLIENSQGFYQPGLDSPISALGSSDYPPVPLYPGMDYDNDILLDLMQQPRPLSSPAVGASEYSATVEVQPYVSEMNTGPSYLFDNVVDYLSANVSQLYIGGAGDSRSFSITSNIDWTVESSADWITTDISAGTGDSPLTVTVESNPSDESRSGTLTLTAESISTVITIFQDAGEVVIVENDALSKLLLFPNPTYGQLQLTNLPPDISTLEIEILQTDGKVAHHQHYTATDGRVVLDISELPSGTYILTLKSHGMNGSEQYNVSRKFTKK